MDDLREELAKLAHEQWSGWMEYLFSKCDTGYMDTLVIPAWAVERWKKQMNTPYEELSDKEKDSDRNEADKFLVVIRSQEFPVIGTSMAIPLHVAKVAYIAYSLRYGDSQSLERIGERGGFAISELDDLLPDWRDYIDR